MRRVSILAMVFKLATQATRDANQRISLTERMRALNIRMRQEIGNMIDVQRTDAGKPKTYDLDNNGEYIAFATATDEDGRNVNVDVKYIFKKGGKPEDGKLIRRRDISGPSPFPADECGQSGAGGVCSITVSQACTTDGDCAPPLCLTCTSGESSASNAA